MTIEEFLKEHAKKATMEISEECLAQLPSELMKKFIDKGFVKSCGYLVKLDEDGEHYWQLYFGPVMSLSGYNSIFAYKHLEHDNLFSLVLTEKDLNDIESVIKDAKKLGRIYFKYTSFKKKQV